MSEEKSNKKLLSGIFSKLKKIKHLDIILTVLFIAIILLIYFSTFSTSSSGGGQTQNIVSEPSQEQQKTSDELSVYAETIETKLEQIISQIKDAGRVRVVVGFDGEIEKVYAYTTKTEELSDGTKVESKSPVLVTNNGQTSPLVLQTIMPKINKIIVVSSGAQNTNVKLEILRAVQAIYEISNIQIFAGS